jgi:hypothetical protein
MTSAAAISGALRRAGFNPLGSGTPRSRQGIRVTGSSGRVRVVALTLTLVILTLGTTS